MKEIRPHSSEYDYAVVLGATCETMQKRVDFLTELVDEGIIFKQLVFLTGQRPLDHTIEEVTEGCRTESDAARWVWRQSKLKQIPVAFIEVPMKPDGKRPTTKDTYEAWLKEKPSFGKALLISNQPYSLYQYALAKSILKNHFVIEIAGPAAPIDKQHGATVLDAMAQWILYDPSGLTRS